MGATTKLMRALALMVVLGLGLAACGSDGGDEDAAEDTTTTAVADDGATDGAAEPADDVDGSDFEGECTEFAQAFAEAAQAVGSAFAGGGAGDIEDIASYFSEIADRMPDAIKEDFRVFAAAYTQFAQALADSDIDMSNPQAMDPEALAALEEVSSAFSSAAVQQASDNIDRYMTETCGG